jgi:predicted TIM-barrel fold metal-dependent hydrolase
MTALTQEPALDPAIQICDPHHHLWEYPESVYLVDDLRADAAGFNLTSTVFVECGSAYRTDGPAELRAVGETEWVRSIGDNLVAGIVGFADLTAGAAVTDVLAAHIESGRGQFRGVRHVSAWDADARVRASHTNPPPDLLLMPSFGEGVAALGRAGLHFEAWLYFTQLLELVELATAQPDVAIVLDHLGGPLAIGPYAPMRDEMLETWRNSMRHVAACDNVVLKVGGIGMPIFGMDWHHREASPGSEEVARVWGPEIRWCIEQFGVDRCMFESNFPVDRRSFSYSVCWNAFLRIAEQFSDAERNALFHDNARRIYRLD